MVIASPASAGEAISRDHFTRNGRLILGVGENPSSIFFMQIVLVNGLNDGSI
jgi:hypothetical protein